MRRDTSLKANGERLWNWRNVWPTIRPSLFLATTPGGWQGSSIGVGWGFWGKDAPSARRTGQPRPPALRFGATRRSWREGCLQAGAMTATRRAAEVPPGTADAVSVTARQRDRTQRHIVRHLLPAQGLGVPCAPGINDRRVTHNMCCVMSRKQGEGSGAQVRAAPAITEHRSRSRSCMTTEVLAHGHQATGRGVWSRGPSRATKCAPIFPTSGRISAAE